MNKLIKRATRIIAMAAMFAGGCKKANDAAQIDTANPIGSAPGIASGAAYRPEIFGSIKEPRGVYKYDDIGGSLGILDVNAINTVTMADAGSITLFVNGRVFIYRLDNADEVITQVKPSIEGMIIGKELTITGTDKDFNSQVTLRFLLPERGIPVIKEASFKFDGLDIIPSKTTPSVIEYNSLYAKAGCANIIKELVYYKTTASVKGYFNGILGYRAGTWSNKPPMAIKGSFNIDTPKM